MDSFHRDFFNRLDYPPDITLEYNIRGLIKVLSRIDIHSSDNCNLAVFIAKTFRSKKSKRIASSGRLNRVFFSQESPASLNSLTKPWLRVSEKVNFEWERRKFRYPADSLDF